MPQNKTFRLEEATIAELQESLASGAVTSVELTTFYLNRIYYYDHYGIRLNAVPLINAEALQQAKAMDELRQAGTILGPMHGIPFTVKDSYMVKGMTVANGSPALAHLTAKEDSFIVGILKAAGGILLGKTNMPPMAAGGMQRGLYGRAESPYNADYLPAAWFSGSSNGSGSSTAANLAVFGMAEETVSSGRSPASNNGLVAYTPSRGLLSIRGNWPLFPVRDVPVPHTRSVADLLAVLDVIMHDDPVTTCDFWREQQAVSLPDCAEFRPDDFNSLQHKGSLAGKRIGVPNIYIGKSGADQHQITIRPSIAHLWEQAAKDLRELGAEVIEVDFPLMDMYQQDPWLLKPFVEQGLLPDGWMQQEWDQLSVYAIEAFLRYVGDENYRSWLDIDPDSVFPNPVGSVDELRGHNNARYRENIEELKRGYQSPAQLPLLNESLQGLEQIREHFFEDWLKANQLDMLAFPANCDIGQSNADVNEAAYDHAWQNGNFFSNTNYVMRHLGIPSVSVCMGMMEDTSMPVNVTFAGPAYSDLDLIRDAYDYEQFTRHHVPAPRTPALPYEQWDYDPALCVSPEKRRQSDAQLCITAHWFQGPWFNINGECRSDHQLRLFINGIEVQPIHEGDQWHAKVSLATLYGVGHHQPSHFDMIAMAKNADGAAEAVALQVRCLSG